MYPQTKRTIDNRVSNTPDMPVGKPMSEIEKELSTLQMNTGHLEQIIILLTDKLNPILSQIPLVSEGNDCAKEIETCSPIGNMLRIHSQSIKNSSKKMTSLISRIQL